MSHIELASVGTQYDSYYMSHIGCICLFQPDFEIELSKLDRGPFDHSGRKLTRSDLFWFSFLGMKRDDPTNKINPP